MQNTCPIFDNVWWRREPIHRKESLGWLWTYRLGLAVQYTVANWSLKAKCQCCIYQYNQCWQTSTSIQKVRCWVNFHLPVEGYQIWSGGFRHTRDNARVLSFNDTEAG